MAKSRDKAKGRRSNGRYLALPITVIESREFAQLSGSSVKILIGMASQYRGANNGDLSATFEQAKGWGIRSQATLSTSLKELQTAGLILRTREGVFMNPGRKCALYAITWQAIDECGGKLDVAATIAPPRAFSMGSRP